MNLTPFTQSDRNALIAMSLNRHVRNIYGDLGPRCPTCSGLGAFLSLGGEVQGVTRSTTRCHCEGSGIDLRKLEQDSNDALWKRIARIESMLKMKPTSKFKLPDIKMSRQYWMECIAWATASGTAVANTATETILFPNVTIPANYMADGRGLRLKLYGAYGTTSTPTLVFAVRWGGVSGTVIAKSSSITTTSGTGSGATMTALWSLEVTMQVRSNGSSGTIMSNGDGILYNSADPTSGTVTNYGLPFAIASGSTGGTTPAAATADFTADTALSVTGKWGTANSANSIQGTNYTVESMN